MKQVKRGERQKSNRGRKVRLSRGTPEWESEGAYINRSIDRIEFGNEFLEYEIRQLRTSEINCCGNRLY